MYDGLMKRIAIYSTVFFVVAMCGMVYLGSNRSPEGINPVTAEDTKTSGTVKKEAREIPVFQELEDSAYLGIPISTSTTEDKILLESNYVEQKLYITIDGLDSRFFDENKIIGDSSYANRVILSYDSGITKLEIQLTNIYEHTAFYKNNMLYLEFVQPREMYGKLIVIDAGGGGASGEMRPGEHTEQSITLAIVKKLKEKLDKTDIRAYYTRTDDSNPTDENRVALSNLLKADMLISIHVSEDSNNEEANGVQTTYNPTYFIPKFSSIDLAYMIEREVVKSTGGKANGLIPAGGSDVLVNEAIVPVAMVEVGYLTNKEEEALLEDEDYITKIANGIYNGIMESYKKIAG